MAGKSLSTLLGIWRQEAAEVGLHAGPPRLGQEVAAHDKFGAEFGNELEQCSVTSSAGKRLATYPSMAARSATSSATATLYAAATSVVLR